MLDQINDGVYLEIRYQGRKLSHKAALRDIPVVGAHDPDLLAASRVGAALDQVVREVQIELRRAERG
ncbi:hypothetical protein [Mycobacterium phage GS4E]|nr:hypothetical protein PBI_AN3_41 [Mycobacterium phage AN3]BBC43861.1 hypothetical protein [Mycobacterium phage GS4E]